MNAHQLYTTSTVASIEAEQARRRSGGRLDAAGSGLDALSDDDLRIWLYGVRHRDYMDGRFDGQDIGVMNGGVAKVVNATTGRPLFAYSAPVDLATGKTIGRTEVFVGAIKCDAALPWGAQPKTTPCVCTAGSCRCPPGYWPTDDELLQEATRQMSRSDSKEKIMKNDGIASTNDFALSYADGIRSAEYLAGKESWGQRNGSSHPVTQARAADRERARHAADPARFDLFKEAPPKSPKQPREDRVVTRMAELTYRACATRGADGATDAEKEELLRLKGSATSAQIDRAHQIARDRRAGVSTDPKSGFSTQRPINPHEGDEDHDKKMDAHGAPRSTYWARRFLTDAEAARLPVTRLDSNEEHPVTRARRENLERMRGLADRGGR